MIVALRRCTLVAVLAAVAVASLGAATADAAPTRADAQGKTLRIGVTQGFNALPLFVGVRYGFFKQAGITDVKFSVFTSPAAMLAAIAGRQMDVGSQSLAAVVSFNRATSGSGVRVVAAGSSGSNIWFAKNDAAIPVATKSDWKSTVRAWKGKKIGVPAPSGILDLFTRQMAAEAGLDSDDYQIVTVGVGPPAVAALQRGLVDVISGDSLTVGLIKDIGKSILSFPLGQGPPEFSESLSGVLLASQDAIEADRALYAGFAAGMVKARAFMRNPKNRRAVMDLLVRKIGLKADEAALVYRLAIVQFTQPTTVITRRTVGQTIAAFVRTGILPPPAPGYDSLAAPFAR